MRNPIHPIKIRISSLKQTRIIYVVLISVGVFLIGIASYDLIAAQFEYYDARAEYDQLRTLFNTAHKPQGNSNNSDQSALDFEPDQHAAIQSDSSLIGLLEINPDFVGWITIAGTEINYPVVRGSDNKVYLSKTFTGKQNASGSIFMDYRCQQGFDEKIGILYGHNMKDGSMFTVLHRFLDSAFMKDHSEINITTLAGETLTYRIFDARRTDILDEAYRLEFFDNATDRLLVLSTCINNVGKDARLLIYAKLSVEN